MTVRLLTQAEPRLAAFAAALALLLVSGLPWGELASAQPDVSDRPGVSAEPAYEPTASEPDCMANLVLLHAVMDAAGPEASATLESTASACEAYRAEYTAVRSELPEAERELRDATFAALLSGWALVQVKLGGDCPGALETLSELSHTLETIPEDARSDFARASHLALSCPPPPAPPAYGAVRVVPGAAPTTLTGVAGGPDDASFRFGGACIGSIPESPSHTLEVPEAMTVSVSVFADYDEDLTLVVTGPGGTFCNDDYFGLNPAVSEWLSPGTYEVYVGEFVHLGYGIGYELEVSDRPLHPISHGSTPTYGVAELTPGGGSVTGRGTAGGPVNARIFGADCVGRISEVPDHRLEVTEYRRVTVEVTSLGESDLTLVVTGPGGTFCNNDFAGFDPAISEWMPAGSYDVYVGDRLSTGVPYSIRFSDADLYAVEPGVLTPQFGTATVSAGAPPITLAGVAAGSDSAGARFGPDCRGFIGWEPNHTVYLDQDLQVWIEAGAAEGGDLTLVISGASGTLCNDDFRGRDPGFAGQLPAGTYDVYVGEFSWTGVGTAYGLRIATSEPTGPVEPPTSMVTLGAGRDRLAVWGRTHGIDPASLRFDPDCPGFVPGFPTSVVTLTEPAQLTVSARSGPGGDLVLATFGPDNAICNDDHEGLNPRLDAWFPAGMVEIYVGEYAVTPEGTAFAATVEAVPQAAPSAPEPEPEPEPEEPAEPVPVTLHDGEPVSAEGVSGGILRGRIFGAECAGYLPELPSFVVEIPETGFYEVLVEGEGDTTLVVDGPSGTFCSDDFDGFNPAVYGQLEEGLYEVYVGSYNPRLRHPFRITIGPAPLPEDRAPSP